MWFPFHYKCSLKAAVKQAAVNIQSQIKFSLVIVSAGCPFSDMTRLIRVIWNGMRAFQDCVSLNLDGFFCEPPFKMWNSSCEIYFGCLGLIFNFLNLDETIFSWDDIKLEHYQHRRYKKIPWSHIMKPQRFCHCCCDCEAAYSLATDMWWTSC